MNAMDPDLTTLLSALQVGEAQTHKNISVLPLICPGDGGPIYLTLGEAIAGNSLVVTEVSQAGSVPDLKVVNRATTPVLLIDGEELMGAKQNRILNTSILLKEHSETVIPVSCTEQGRWAHVSPAFADSGVHMPYKMRAHKTSSVSTSLASHGLFHSDQAEVWHHVSALHAKVGTSSPTGAMKAAFEGRRAELELCQKAFTPVPGQNGLLVLIDGAVAGLDVVSRPQAYEQLHSKLLRSYLLEALVELKPASLEPVQAKQRALAFIEEIGHCETSRFESVGYGLDVRFRKSDLAGTALVHENCVVHCAFFRLTPADEPGRMAMLRHRRLFTG